MADGDPRRAEILQLMGLCADWRSEYSHARELFGKAYQLALASEQWALAARCLHNQGRCYELEGEDNLALVSFERSIELKQLHDLVHDIPISMLNIGGLIYVIAPERWAEAVQMLKRARWQAADGKNARVEGDALSNLGTAYRTQGALEDALHSFRAAEVVFDQAGYRYDVADTRVRIAETLLDQGEALKATVFTKGALEIFESIRNEEGIIWATRALAEAELSLGNHAAAGRLLYPWQAEAALVAVTDVYERVLLLIALGKVAAARDDQEEVFRRRCRALQLAAEHQFNDLVARIKEL